MSRRSRRIRMIALLAGALLALLALILWRAGVERGRPLPSVTQPPASQPPTQALTQAPTAVPTESATPAPTPRPTPAATVAPKQAEKFELPVVGATGYASISMNLRSQASSSSQLVATLEPGTPFRIIGESGAWFRVKTADESGWLASKFCLVNLPDIIPSIVYDATNTYGSIVVSSGKALPGITGKGLYTGKVSNERLGERQFIMPVLYQMAKKVYAAQQYALKNGETLVLYEAYRPYEVQMTIVKALTALAQSDGAVMRGISGAPWSLSWFASTRLSNHQRGCAIDVSLAKIDESEQRLAGEYGYTRVTAATRYQMPTQMHELSAASAAFSAPVDSKSKTAWKQAEPTAAMNEAALRLQSYCARAGLTPLASEWWHFNDLDAAADVGANQSTGRYELTVNRSIAP